jgi:hypothetical protein
MFDEISLSMILEKTMLLNPREHKRHRLLVITLPTIPSKETDSPEPPLTKVFHNIVNP